MRECKVLVIQAGSLPHLKKMMSQEVAGTTLCPILLPRLEEGDVCTVAFTRSPDWSLKDPQQAMSLVCWQGQMEMGWTQYGWPSMLSLQPCGGLAMEETFRDGPAGPQKGPLLLGEVLGEVGPLR